MTHVIQVVLNTFIDGRVASPAIHLSPSSDPDFQKMASIVAPHGLHEALNKQGPLRPWPDHTHVSPEHVEELRQFVEAGAPQDAAKGCASWIIFHSPTGITIGL